MSALTVEGERTAQSIDSTVGTGAKNFNFGGSVNPFIQVREEAKTKNILIVAVAAVGVVYFLSRKKR